MADVPVRAMLIHIGLYRLWPKRVAFRNDYCLTCQQERRAIRLRTLDVVYVFFIPLLPIGLWKHWCCSSCGKDPHAHRGTGSSLKWAAVLVLIFVAVLFGLQAGVPAIVRIVITGMAAVLVLYLFHSPRETALRERLASVPIASDTSCPFCSTPLVGGTRWSCPACGVIRC